MIECPNCERNIMYHTVGDLLTCELMEVIPGEFQEDTLRGTDELMKALAQD